MKSLLNELSEAFENTNLSFIFPSEIASDFWKKKLLRESAKKAVRSDRFLSWDSYKELVTESKPDVKPINRYLRLLFADDLCEKNARASRFSSLIPSRYHPESRRFADYIAGILPQLYHDYLPVYRHPRFSRMEQSLLRDLEYLEKTYAKFLEDNRMFEPGAVKPIFRETPGDFLLLFPQVLEDFGVFKPYIDTSRVKMIGDENPGSPESERPPFTYFPNALMEARWLCGSLADLTDRIKMEEIVLTTPSKDTLSLVKEEAALYGLPLSIQWGESLSAYPAGRFFRLLSGCVNSGYGIAHLKNLLLNRTFPWRTPEKNRDLLRFGREYFCIRNYISENKYFRVWEENLTKTGNQSLLEYFKRLSSLMKSIVDAESFGQIKQRLALFTSLFFDKEAWDPEHRAVFERCLTLCDVLEEAAASLGGLKPSGPFTLFLLSLDKQVYVRQSGTGGIPVYPYRVSAGIYPARHFVFGLSSRETQVRIPVLPYLRSDYKAMAEVTDTDLTEPFGRLYIRSGETVYSTGSRETTAGAALPPAIFLDGLDHGGDEESPLSLERDYWSGRAPNLPDRLFPVQKEGFAYFAQTGRSTALRDITEKFCTDPDLIKEICASLADEEGNFHVSPSSLETYNSCPFSYLFRYVFGLEEEGESVQFSDPATIGTLYHLVMKEMYDGIKKENGRIEGRALGTWVKDAARIVHQVFDNWERRKPIFPAPVWLDVKERAIPAVETCLASDTEVFDGYAISATENTLKWIDRESRISYLGKIDRILEKDSCYQITDYKKTLSVKQRDLISPDTETPPASSQIPFYILLMEKNGYPVEGASYYDFSKGKSADVFSKTPKKKTWFSGDEMEELLEGIVRNVKRMVANTNRGGFLATPSDTSCVFCPLSRLCRTKYFIR